MFNFIWNFLKGFLVWYQQFWTSDCLVFSVNRVGRGMLSGILQQGFFCFLSFGVFFAKAMKNGLSQNSREHRLSAIKSPDTEEQQIIDRRAHKNLIMQAVRPIFSFLTNIFKSSARYMLTLMLLFCDLFMFCNLASKGTVLAPFKFALMMMSVESGNH